MSTEYLIFLAVGCGMCFCNVGRVDEEQAVPPATKCKEDTVLSTS